MKTKILIFALFTFLTYNGSAQIIKSKLDLVAGISAREYAHFGIRYQYSEITQLGFYVGNDMELRQNETINTFSVDNMIHFGELSFFSNRPVWYARQGYTFSKNQTGDQLIEKYSYINISLGREIAFNDWFGINADLGVIWQFREYTDDLDNPRETPINNHWYLMPLARIQLFLSF